MKYISNAEKAIITDMIYNGKDSRTLDEVWNEKQKTTSDLKCPYCQSFNVLIEKYCDGLEGYCKDCNSIYTC